MPNFETFAKSMVSLKREPQITVQRRGTMSLNRSAHVALGSPDAVELLYDTDERIIGLRPVDPRADHAYPIRPATKADTGPFMISAMAFIKYYDIDTTQSLRWTAYLDDGVLCINLNDPPTPVTSNRARNALRTDQPPTGRGQRPRST